MTSAAPHVCRWRRNGLFGAGRAGALIFIAGIAALLAGPSPILAQTLDVEYFRGRCDVAAPVPALLCPGAVPVADTTGPAGIPDGFVNGLDVPCHDRLDCGGLTCYWGVCTGPAAPAFVSCNSAADCGLGAPCANRDVDNDTNVLCWADPVAPPGFCADIYHGDLGPGITKGQEADGVCPSGGIPAPAGAPAPLFWMLNTNDVGGIYTGTGTVNPAFTTCYDPNPLPGPAPSPIVSPPAPAYGFPALFGLPLLPGNQDGVALDPAQDPNPPVLYLKYYHAGFHACGAPTPNDLGNDSRPMRCSTPGINPGNICGPAAPCALPSICLGAGAPILRQAPDYDGLCGIAAGPPPTENLCP